MMKKITVQAHNLPLVDLDFFLTCPFENDPKVLTSASKPLRL